MNLPKTKQLQLEGKACEMTDLSSQVTAESFEEVLKE